jgi:soluble lytic murein transglycosylase-like protein
MNYIIIISLSFVISIFVGYGGMSLLNKNNTLKNNVLGYQTKVKLNYYPTNTPTPSSTPTPIPTNTPILTPTQIPQNSYSQEEIHKFIERYSVQYNVDPNILRYIATCESGFNSIATNNSYAGLYQFSPITWSNLRKDMGENENIDLRYNAEESAQSAAYALSIGRGSIWPNCIP